MSWIPAAGGLYQPTSRTAPKPSGATPTFSFGHLTEGAEATPHPGANPANYDPAPQKLRWWELPRGEATVSGAQNKDIEAYWAAAAGKQGNGLQELPGAEQRKANRAEGTGCHLKLGDEEGSSLASASSCYKSDHCVGAGHRRMGKRGVVQSPEAMQAYEDSRRQAQRNKAQGVGANLRLTQF